MGSSGKFSEPEKQPGKKVPGDVLKKMAR